MAQIKIQHTEVRRTKFLWYLPTLVTKNNLQNH